MALFLMSLGSLVMEGLKVFSWGTPEVSIQFA